MVTNTRLALLAVELGTCTGGVKTDPVQHSVLASQLLEKAIDQLFQDSQN